MPQRKITNVNKIMDDKMYICEQGNTWVPSNDTLICINRNIM